MFLVNSVTTKQTWSSANYIQLFVSETLAATLKQCLAVLGQQGGTIEPTNFLVTEFGDVEYAFDKRNVFLSQMDLETELANCIQDNLLICMEGFPEIQQLNLDMSAGNPIAAPVLSTSDTSIALELPVEIKTKDGRQVFSEFATNVPVRLGTLHNVTATVSQDRAIYELSSDFDLTYLGNLDIDSNIYQFGNAQVYELRDHQSQLGAIQYIFLSAHSFE